MKRMQSRTGFLLALAGAFALVSPQAARAVDVGAGFADGNGTSSSDQFPGTAGDGWLTAWSGTGTSSSVVATSPIESGNYLSSSRPSVSGSSTLRRQFDLDAGQMSAGLPYDVEWTWRFDGDISHMTTSDDRVHFFADTGPISGSGASNSWLIGASATLNGSGGFDGGNFYFYRNTGTTPGAFNDSQMINTGLALESATAGNVFQFKVIVDPDEGRYDATITDKTTGASFTAANLKFRNATTDASSTSYLHFGSNANSSGDDTTFSLDSIRLTAHHRIVANFDDRNDANKIDTFNDSQAGGGWAGGWLGVGSGTSGTVATTDPLEGPDDPYLAVTMVAAASGDQYYEVSRKFEDFGAIDVNRPHLITWKWRLDGDLADFTDSGDDRINFYADNDTAAGTNDSNAWLIGATSDRGGFVNGDFYFYDGTSDNGFTSGNTVPTGITLQEDVEYRFAVLVNPLTKSYDATITDELGNTFTATGLKFRNFLTGTPGVTWDRLHFGANLNGSGDDLSFSLDSLVITQVPEPSAGLMVATLLGLGLLGWWRRK